LRYLSVCSGIEAATVAWHPLGWKAAAYSEIEKFPSQVLAHHYPNVPNVGDMTKFKEWTNVSNVDVLVGGTPCQSFSVAGLRKGLDDPRGNLMLTYLAIATKFRPKWLVWENVPGVLSSNGGLDFASLLRGMGECGYGFAYRILDAQYFGVAQRRKRVFVVGCLGDWRAAAAVLFERHSLSGYPAPSREKRKSVTAIIGDGTQVSHLIGGQDCKHFSSEISGTIVTREGSVSDTSHMLMQPIPIDSMNHIGRGDKHSMGDFVPGAPCYTLTKGHSHAVAQPMAYTFSGGSNRGLHVNKVQVATCLDTHNAGGEFREQSQNAQTLVAQPMAFDLAQITSATNRSRVDPELPAGTILKRSDMHIASLMAVRRLLPVECERLQGFPDNYTNIKDKCPDGPRYKALGNSMAVPVMAWIGKRIQEVENLQCKQNK
jgi:DNA (cytosine-5)-methyltransferase 1